MFIFGLSEYRGSTVQEKSEIDTRTHESDTHTNNHVRAMCWQLPLPMEQGTEKPKEEREKGKKEEARRKRKVSN